MNIIAHIVSASFGALSASTLIAIAGQPEIPNVAPIIERTVSHQIYTCHNLPAQPAPDELYALRELSETCRITNEAMLMIETWKKDPQANIVYE